MARGSRSGRGRGRDDAPDEPSIIGGKNPVLEALRAGRGVKRLVLADSLQEDDTVDAIVDLAAREGTQIERRPPQALDQMVGRANHQGVVAVADPRGYASVEDLLARAEARGEDPFILLLDGVEDPHNLGAVLRVADCAGVHGVVIPERRAAGLTPGALKASAGAAEYVPVAQVANLMDAVKKLKDAEVWIGAAEADEGRDMWQERLTGPLALVMGSEGSGVSRTLLKHCDFRVRIPMRGHVNSLNVSVATALLVYERLRQQSA